MNPELKPDRYTEAPRTDGWLASLLSILCARIEIIQIESRQWTRERSRSLSLLGAGLICGIITWLLLLVGSIAAIAEASGWQWHFITLIAAALHLITTLFLLKAARRPQAPPFPVTRSEFQKDREWIQSLQKTPDSRN